MVELENKIKKLNKTNNKHFIPKNSRHIRYGHEPSGEFDFDNELVKYHFIFVDDSDFDRKKMRDKVYNQISKVDSRISDNYEVNGKVRKSKLGYLYLTFNSIVSPEFLKLKDIGVPVRFDIDLKSRKVLNVMDYIIRLYE